MLSSPVSWVGSALAFAIAGVLMLLPLARLWPASEFRRRRRAVVMAASIFWPAFAVLLTQTLWDVYYGLFYPGWMRWATPIIIFAVFPPIAFACHYLASRLPGHPLLWFCLLVGVSAALEHGWGFYGAHILERVPYFQSAPAGWMLVFSFFEYQVYWAVALWLAWGLIELEQLRRGAPRSVSMSKP
jgi:hypothetical protein